MIITGEKMKRFAARYFLRETFFSGPTPLPFIGNLHVLLWHEPGYSAFEMWRKQYGPIYTYWIGETSFNVVSYTYRGEYGVVETTGQLWRDHRRFALHVLRSLGLSKNIMERRILAEVEAMSETLHTMEGEEIEMQIFDVGVGSVINQLLFGYRFEAVVIINKFIRLALCRDAVFSFFDRQIDAHQKHIDYDAEESNDYVEAFLKEKRRRETNGDTESFSNVQLQNMCHDLWSAGMETTSNTLSWGVVYLLNNLDVQKVHEEMDRELGPGRLITMLDRCNLPYTNAVINEIQRMANLLPMNLPHMTLCPVQVGKWSLPAHTGVIAQISNVLYDNEIYPSPLIFDPTRFIDEDGKLKKVEELIPFSIGKRQCLGEGLARMELFLFIANLCNRFEVQKIHFLSLSSSNKEIKQISPFKLSSINPSEPPTTKKTFGLTVKPCPYRCLARTRFA
uniref:Unspecific monooxygenase n=1 Tax=Angiostrongylus cantonensis TaxID=6313 RepID=A0A158P6Z6_ANGCA